MREYNCTCGDGDNAPACPECEDISAFHLIGCMHPVHANCPDYGVGA